jgi:hypothetical protein
MWCGTVKRVMKKLLALTMIASLAGCAAPRMTAPENPDAYYFNSSVRLGETGVVVLRFSIGPDGKAREPILHDDPTIADLAASGDRQRTAQRLIEAAERYIRAATFDARGVRKRHLTASVVFEIKPCGKIGPPGTYDYAVRLCREKPPRPNIVTP